MNFEDKVILVTGASSGIGAAIAIKFSTLRAKIAIVARNETRLQAVADIIERNGAKPLIIIADVTKNEDTKRILSETLDHFGKLNVLVNNVGVFDRVSILDPCAMEKFDHIITTNLRSTVQLTHLAAPHLIETKGNIVNISSAGSKGIFMSGNFSYCTSKAGLDHFSRCIALELGPNGVRVNCVNPGPVMTDIVKETVTDQVEYEAFWENLKKISPLGKFATVEEVANVVAFLASDAAGSITGSNYDIDNGILLK